VTRSRCRTSKQLIQSAAVELRERRLAAVEERIEVLLRLGRHHELVGELMLRTHTCAAGLSARFFRAFHLIWPLPWLPTARPCQADGEVAQPCNRPGPATARYRRRGASLRNWELRARLTRSGCARAPLTT